MSDSPTATHQQHVEALYVGHQGWLYAWLQRKLGNRVEAADLMHDTFIRILAAKSVPDLVEPRAYLTCVAKGILINWYQRQALERAYLSALAQLPESQAPSPELRYLILETLHEVDALLNTLPPLVKRAFLLAQISAVKYEDIAQQLDVSLTTVKRYIKQAFLQCLTLMPE
ncbi:MULTISPECIES: sigma-70 family RNA polymerase sigma factor [unclassified Pseudomonas]|jgi:RNA polymerase sigma-70 factor (ECF subfamily)|uniref:sigma-70 family RNA polymerase sigma factor n=1 Tax=unclassified Pseudomonas TaxID=196821 RepID=UPI000BA2C09B|nr:MULTISPECIES: sigma-70 family RNA polymerase sigma factor [unclassified Pseudomonas]MDX9663879.1 sigma-70 family RNA polymerase sigma factor [Pseudomonas sp. P5_152]QHD01883.1 RNA polymerase subunit sigma [Pseudomonas sp. S04]QHF34366.1 RNA polymerase subunit sigma [Pseudomonas sp. S19]